MREAAAGPFVAGCLLLMAAGVAKLRRPAAARRTLAAAGLRVPGWTVTAGGAAELAVGAFAVAGGGRAAAFAVAACYAGFATFVALLMGRERNVGCGCFGETAAPLGPLHVVVNVALAIAALTVAGAGGLAAAAPPARPALAVLGAALAWVAYLTLVPLPLLLQTVRESRS